MIILIGGNGYMGKTLMAQKLLEKYNVPYLSIDHLKMGIYRADSNCGFTPLDSLEHISEKLWGILKGIIMTNIENKQHLIIEGCYLMPEKIKELEQDEEYSTRIISFYMGFSEKYIEHYFDSVILKNMGAIEDRIPEDNDDITKDIYITETAKIKKMCEDSGAKYFELDGEYNQEMQRIYQWIHEQIKSQRMYIRFFEGDNSLRGEQNWCF
jgi:putative acetyltransferase